MELLEQQLATRMEQLQATVQSKTAVPTAQVYVSFHMLHVKDRLIFLSYSWKGKYKYEITKLGINMKT